jgi:hypothetical protein
MGFGGMLVQQTNLSPLTSYLSPQKNYNYGREIEDFTLRGR